MVETQIANNKFEKACKDAEKHVNEKQKELDQLQDRYDMGQSTIRGHESTIRQQRKELESMSRDLHHQIHQLQRQLHQTQTVSPTHGSTMPRAHAPRPATAPPRSKQYASSPGDTDGNRQLSHLLGELKNLMRENFESNPEYDRGALIDKIFVTICSIFRDDDRPETLEQLVEKLTLYLEDPTVGRQGSKQRLTEWMGKLSELLAKHEAKHPPSQNRPVTADTMSDDGSHPNTPTLSPVEGRERVVVVESTEVGYPSTTQAHSERRSTSEEEHGAVTRSEISRHGPNVSTSSNKSTDRSHGPQKGADTGHEPEESGGDEIDDDDLEVDFVEILKDGSRFTHYKRSKSKPKSDPAAKASAKADPSSGTENATSQSDKKQGDDRSRVRWFVDPNAEPRAKPVNSVLVMIRRILKDKYTHPSSIVMYNFGVGPRFAYVSASARAPK